MGQVVVDEVVNFFYGTSARFKTSVHVSEHPFSFSFHAPTGISTVILGITVMATVRTSHSAAIMRLVSMAAEKAIDVP